MKSVLQWAVLGPAMLVPSLAYAGDATLAEGLFREGKALMQANDYERACPKLAESLRQDPATGTQLALALCQEKQGLLASAWTNFSSVATAARREGRQDREKVARERAAAIEPRLSRLTVEVPPDVGAIPGLVITRNGEPVPPAAWGTALPTDPGEHVLVAKAQGKATWTGKVTLGAVADRQVLRIPALAAAATESKNDAPVADATGAPSAPVTASPSDRPPASGMGKQRLIGIVVGGVGVAALGVGGFFALRASSLNDESKANQHCDASGCDELGLGKNKDALSAGRLSTIFVVTGGVLAAGGVTLYLTGSPTRPQQSSLRLTPGVGPGSSGLSLQGVFH